MTENDIILELIGVVKNIHKDVEQLKCEIMEIRAELGCIETYRITGLKETKEDDRISKKMDILFDFVY